jgi:cysteine desulfurase/selenocysteine lyase
MNPTAGHSDAKTLDAGKVRSDFPALQQEVNGHPLVYLDNAATAQKPRAVIDAIDEFYSRDNANVHRGVHTLSLRATERYESARETVREFLGAAEASEIVFVRGATEGINLVAGSYGRTHVGAGDEVLITAMEHHSNIVPWQMLCEATGAKLRVAPMNHDGELLVDEFRALVTDRTRIVALTHVANAIGTVNPVAELAAIAHDRGVPVLVDGAQAAPHLAVDVRALGADFYVLSAHKAYGPTGAGALYTRRAILEEMPPWQGGGDMIASVSFEKTTYNKVPHRFEAGTPNIAGAVGMATALDYLRGLDLDAVAAHEDDVLEYAVSSVGDIPGVNLVGTPARRAGAVSFTIDGVHPHDAGTILDREGVAIRAGHHCSQPLMDFYGVPATNRASFGVYNTREDVDRLVAGIRKVIEVFA